MKDVKVKRPDLLEWIIKISDMYLPSTSRRKSRALEYTWILEVMLSMEGHTAIDVGAGVSPIPICLVYMGWDVTTVDKLTDSYDQWGFYQYPDGISSINANFKDLDLDPVDVIYSISAVEHMPADERREVFSKAYETLNDGGHFLMTIDLERDTDNIWNYNMGERIEDNHGMIGDIVYELFEMHFEEININTERGIKGVGTDLLFIHAKK